MPSVLPTGGYFARARRRTKTLPDTWEYGARLEEAILGYVAATPPKMAGAGMRGWDRISVGTCFDTRRWWTRLSHLSMNPIDHQSPPHCKKSVTFKDCTKEKRYSGSQTF